MSAFNAVKYKDTTREQWQAAAKAWNEWGPCLRAWLGPATKIMLDMARIGPGSRVLDVAAGAGDQTLQVAEQIGSQGHVLATDIAPNILVFAAQNARNAGYSNVKTAVMDGENLDVPEETFDAVISRVGLIYFPDQQKALAGMKRALKPGGRIAAIVYSLLLDSGLDHPPARCAAAAAAGPTRTFQPRWPGSSGECVPDGRIAGRAKPARASAAAAEVGRGMRPLREGVIRRLAPDAVRA
jgi:SAM-dependent methyltransferase